jgi:hypothetical protein
MKQPLHSHSVEQDVEWMYALDVHANSFFCSFMVTYVLQVSFKDITKIVPLLVK